MSFSSCSCAPIDRRRNVNIAAGFRRLGTTAPADGVPSPARARRQVSQWLESTMATMGPFENGRRCNTVELSLACAPRLDSPSTILGRPLVSPGFAGLVPGNLGHRRGEPGGAAVDLFSKRIRPVAAIHYRNRSDSFQSRHEAGAGNRRVAMASCRSKLRIAVRALVKPRERPRRRIRRRTFPAHR
jgi:hypothetical protein